MFDFSLGELLLIAVVALVVIGPQDLPKVLHATFKFFRQVQDVLSEVRRSFDEVVATSGIDEVRKDLDRELNKDAKFIIDQHGNYQQIYDVSDLMKVEAQKQSTPKVLPDER